MIITLGCLDNPRHLFDAIIRHDATKRMRANRALATHLGITLEAGPRALLETTRQPEIIEHVRAVRATRSPARREIVIAGPPERAFLLSSSPVAPVTPRAITSTAPAPCCLPNH